ncbi:dihydropteroate synthase [Catenulispora rubra]|uniref:dihydropteroate synthase n=1 Tax=Catenulispora rubra TaxID=280293 RepID=UPI0018924939|nr:dihydropteroate synthase [Catenulispora rubra]
MDAQGRPLNRSQTVRGLPEFGRCAVFGVVNVTPDSFSDGGEYYADGDTAKAVAHGLRLHRHGVDVVDVGGESTRPGAARVTAEQELGRVLPVIEQLAAAGVRVSVDTMRASTAAAALDAGAVVVNDVSGGLADPEMFPLVAETGVPYILMHWRGHSTDMQTRAVYGDVVKDVIEELQARYDAALAAGIAEDQVILDPGLGFAKNADHNWALLAHLEKLESLGRPLLIAASRKNFLGRLLADEAGGIRPPHGRDSATVAVSALVAAAGAWGVRAHDALGSLDAVRVASALAAAR